MSAPGDLKTPFFEEAMQILADEGYGGLKLAPLCKRLGVTTGAFYHSFKNWNDFTTQLIERWRQERTQSFIDLVHAETDPLGRIDLLVHAAVTIPREAEAAIRVWSTIDADLAKVQEEVDRARYEIVREAFNALLPAETAEHYAKAGMYLLIGAEQSQGFNDKGALEWALGIFRASAVEEAERNR